MNRNKIFLFGFIALPIIAIFYRTDIQFLDQNSHESAIIVKITKKGEPHETTNKKVRFKQKNHRVP
jgi:hypothetical protein